MERQQQPAPPARADGFARSLASLRSRARVVLVAKPVGLLLAALFGAALVAGLLDMWLRFPAPLRVGAWLAAGVCAALLIVRAVLPALRFCPNLTDVALRVEELHPEWKGTLASAVDFDGASGRAYDSATTRALEEASVRAAAERFDPARVESLVDREPAVRGVGLALVALVLALAPALFSGGMWAIGAQRVLLPWTDAAWPKRTGVVDATALRSERVHPSTEALPLRALLTKWRTNPDSTDVTVRYRSFNEAGDAGRTMTALLTLQGRTESEDSGEAYLFERLLDVAGSAVEYQISTEDDATEWTRVRLIDPPAITSASAVITPPEYARLSTDAPPSIDLGAGFDERAAAPPALQGSRVDFELTLNRAGARPEGATSAAESLAAIIGDAGDVLDIEAEGTSLRASFLLRETVRLALPLVDEFGIPSEEASVYRFESVADRPAAVTITEPERDRTVLPTAVVEIVAEGRDDVGLERVSIERTVWRPAGGAAGGVPSGPGGALEPEAPAVEIARVDRAGGALEPTATARVVSAPVDLGELGLNPGDEVSIVALAADAFRSPAGEGRGATRSTPRVLRIIDEETFVDEVRDALAGVRESAIRLEQQQGELRDSTAQRGAERTTERAQAQVAQRLDQQLEELGDIAQRVGENNLDNQALSELLEEAMLSTERAAEAASEAAQSLAEARAQSNAAEADDESALSEEQQETIGDAQDEAQTELASLIEMLDRGEDNWVLRNEINRLAEQQRALQEETARLGRETAGLSPEQLSEAQQRALEEIAQEQEELAQETDELLDDLREREQMLRDEDPAAAEGLRQAAQRAQQEQTVQRQQEAAEQAQQNQTSEAQQNQEEAAESLEEMLEDLENNERNRREALRRNLLSLIDSIKGLITEQETAIGLLRAGETLPAGLAQGMIALAQNTLAVSALATQSGPETASIAGVLDRAEGAQSRAIVHLRSEPAELDDARADEERSLELLEEALGRAEELDEQLEQEENERKKRELERAYRDALEMQIGLRDRTAPFGELEELSRRDRVRLRQLGPSQEDIRRQLETLVQQTEEMEEARVYRYAHTRMDRMSQQAEDAIREAEPALALNRQEAIIAALLDLIDSLNDPEPDENPFDQEQQAGQGGQGGGQGGQQEQLFSDLGQLRLLRELQIALAEETAFLDALEATSPEDLGFLAGQQEELAEIAVEIIERMTRSPVPLEFLPENGGRAPSDPPRGGEPAAEGGNPLDDAPEANDAGTEAEGGSP